MKALNIFSFSFFQVFCTLFAFIIFILGGLNIHFSDINNYCDMTYMFEYPQFVRIPEETISKNNVISRENYYSQYQLYVYSEGRLTEKARKMWFDGVPVLFLPGNLGSLKQIRSLASVALRMAISYSQEYHFDYFTVDYNEELSGLYGGVLNMQTEYAAQCISRILSLYTNNKYVKTIPSTVILVGHSMGGVIAKRLLAYTKTFNMTCIAITLAAPLEAPMINFDQSMNQYYFDMEREWAMKSTEMQSKLLLSFGSGARDILIPSSLTGSRYSDINALTTAVPNVWVSPDHVSIVWCKQFVMAINKFLFSIVNPETHQVFDSKQVLMAQATTYFQANRSMILNKQIKRPIVAMIADAFWYEDNRRIYQITRPEIVKTTYLMIRLVNFPQNRFVAVETVNHDDKDWLFGCNTNSVYRTHRYCKSATSLTELSRWTAAANKFGKRKLGTIHLHKIMEEYPDWTHVLVKVSPTRKPVTLNVDINDYASREVTVNLPYLPGKTVIIQETEQNSLYYELSLPGLTLIRHTYYLYVEPTESCKAKNHHASAELHVPWAKNHEYYHYFTHLKSTPMKIRVFKNNPNITNNLDAQQHVKITLLLDPQCTYVVSISLSWYHQLGQLVRNYFPVMVPYISAIIILVVRSNIINLMKDGTCTSLHKCLASDCVKPYYVLVAAKLVLVLFGSVPLLSYIFETASSRNGELQYFLHSLLSIVAYITALGIVNSTVTVIIALMVSYSQIAHRLLLRIVWRGSSSNLAENVASGLRKVPMLVSVSLTCAVPLSSGAAALAGGALFYSFMLSKLFEEYLEDYLYRIMAIIGSKVCYYFKSQKPSEEESTALVPTDDTIDKGEDNDNKIKAIDNAKGVKAVDSLQEVDDVKAVKSDIGKEIVIKSSKTENKENDNDRLSLVATETNEVQEETEKCNIASVDRDEQLSGLNFHVMMFSLWIIATLLNITALLTWARNFKHSMVLKPDHSYFPGIIMSICSGFVWQIEAPRANLKYYEFVSQVLFVLATLTLVIGPLGAYYINYIITLVFALITIQQVFDEELTDTIEPKLLNATSSSEDDDSQSKSSSNKPDTTEDNSSASNTSTDNCECNENRIYNMFRNFKEKFTLTVDPS